MKASKKDGGDYSEIAQIRIINKGTEMKFYHLLTVVAKRSCELNFYEKFTLFIICLFLWKKKSAIVLGIILF